MRSKDFSQAPPQARAEAVFLGANRYRSPLAMLAQVRRWPKVARSLKRAPGYLWHRSYVEFPDRIGLIVAFASYDDLMLYARTPEHREIMKWLVGGEKAPARGGFIRILRADEWGYTNGEYRAEDSRLGMIDEFTRLEADTRQVADGGSAGGRSTGRGAGGGVTGRVAGGRPAERARSQDDPERR
ncbi:hypothetical protein DFO66_11575 [Brevibacterium sanguinis]|uniref:DUF4188 domain-containing protein n=2 Tax=Brevibacterium TaxID=1696 RepID=A0A366IDK6_9MICO|nr:MULTISPECIES: hypothetical protein [Brevibacterium]RBP62409.1 hypothetical protein DFO66_11575 [Brevibacterium sanguinis]RBP68798.1 hypothetical protein DFO65_11575 [Brevibacterium celere]